jgi:hypothetical protein
MSSLLLSGRPSVKVDRSAATGVFNVEWFNPTDDKTFLAEKISAGAPLDFTAPFQGDAVLYIRKDG